MEKYYQLQTMMGNTTIHMVVTDPYVMNGVLVAVKVGEVEGVVHKITFKKIEPMKVMVAGNFICEEKEKIEWR